MNCKMPRFLERFAAFTLKLSFLFIIIVVRHDVIIVMSFRFVRFVALLAAIVWLFFDVIVEVETERARRS